MSDLLTKIRPVKEEDKEILPIFSYSRLDTFKQCPMRYKLKYIENKYTDETTLSLEFGTLLHYILEQKGKALIEKNKINYDELFDFLENGGTVEDDKTHQTILGVNQLKKKYFEIWYEKNEKSGLTYEDKISNYKKILYTEMEDSENWEPYKLEYPFEFVWDDRVIFGGFIDRIDIKYIDKTPYYRTIDYKSSNSVYPDKNLPTALQFVIYALAIYNEFGVLPEENIYRFITLDQTQKALSIGWEKRAEKALDKLFNLLDECQVNGIYKPSPSPLCFYCNYSLTNQNKGVKLYNNECQYYSNWNPNDRKNFTVNKKWEEGIDNKESKRKLVF